jgi:hypothetical protein
MFVPIQVAAAPTTRPAEVDPSSPELALLCYVDAIERGDMEAYVKIIYPRNADERQTIQQVVTMDETAQRLVSATRNRLGDAAASKVRETLGFFGLGPSKEAAESLRDAMQGAEWKVHGDDAVLGEISPEIHFRRIDGQWRLLVPLDVDAPPLDERLKNTREFIEAIERITRRVNAGELTTGEQIRDALGRLMPIAMHEPETQPATAPSRP